MRAVLKAHISRGHDPYPGYLHTGEFLGDERICRIPAKLPTGQLIYGNREGLPCVDAVVLESQIRQ